MQRNRSVYVFVYAVSWRVAHTDFNWEICHCNNNDKLICSTNVKILVQQNLKKFWGVRVMEQKIQNTMKIRKLMSLSSMVAFKLSSNRRTATTNVIRSKYPLWTICHFQWAQQIYHPKSISILINNKLRSPIVVFFLSRNRMEIFNPKPTEEGWKSKHKLN